MVVPPYCTTSGGRVFRILRSSQFLEPGRVRFVLRAQPILAADASANIERCRVLDAEVIRDKIHHRQAIPTPETTFEDLWRELKVDLDLRDA